ncbi:MAG: D-alanine--D-alanine ligase [Kiritimatiellaeota bacterium]|nr:D-alanine--D-alanine ligase [Kiritimatiellota bacterium]
MKHNCVAVVMGGLTNEREVSLRSGAAITKALRETGRDVREVVMGDPRELRFDVDVQAVFLALHGGEGENGGVQKLLDAMGMPYTGSGAEASRLAMDKIASKKIFDTRGIPTAAWEVVCGDAPHVTQLGFPLVVKPPREGSSVGVARVASAEDLPQAIRDAAKFDEHGEVLLEAFVPGREWAVGVLGRRALPPVEIQAHGGWYDYAAKYDPGQGTRYVFPDDAALIARCQKIALDVFDALGCRGLGRVDFRITDADEPFVLEMNTLPGFTATSLFPKAAAQAGISFAEVCAEILELAARG